VALKLAKRREAVLSYKNLMKEETGKKEYELTFWLKDENDLAKIKSLMDDLGLEITYAPELRHTQFAYPIKKEASGFFGFFHFMGNVENIASFNHELKVGGACLRFLISKNPIKKSEVREIRRQVTERKIEKAEPKPSDMVTNEELEKKLEEILK
jgi:ribosomal protein S6